MQTDLIAGDYVSASQLRNHINNDPLLDWLDRWGSKRGFVRDDDLPTYRKDCDFARFLFRKGREFEVAVVNTLDQRLHGSSRTVVASSEMPSLDDHERTCGLMRASCPMIVQGALFDSTSRTYGVPDLLVRADILNDLIGEPPLNEHEIASAGYVVVDIKYSSFDLLKVSGEPESNKRSKMIQVAVYERALAQALGRQVGRAFLLGRSVHTKDTEKSAPRGCFDRLAPVTVREWLHEADVAAEWIRNVQRNGADWDPFHPHRPELVPNLSNDKDHPWHHTKQTIAQQTKPLNALWQVGWAMDVPVDGRFRRWDDPDVCAEHLVSGPKRRPALAAILEANTTPEFVVGPPRIRADEGAWRAFDGVEFFVDFETVTDLDDDFAQFPVRGGSPRIFMVGCGHVEDDQWRFECFVADDLTDDSERRLLDCWLAHMNDTVERLRPGAAKRLYHWSHAEKTFLETSYNSAQKRLGGDWPRLEWYDLLNNVAKAEPVVVRGAMAFGLKAVAKAMHAHGLIETRWEEGPMDGLAASVAAWNCAKRTSPMHADPLMDEVRQYNEVDCRVMWEILMVLRRNH